MVQPQSDDHRPPCSAPAPAPPQTSIYNLKAKEIELLKSQDEYLQRHREIDKVIDVIRSTCRIIPQPYASMIYQAAVLVLRSQEAEMRAVEGNLVALMLETREIAGIRE